MFTIRQFGENNKEYFLCNGWGKPNSWKMWKEQHALNDNDLFKRKQDAKTSLAKLIKVMSDYVSEGYKTDLVEIEPSGNVKVLEPINFKWTRVKTRHGFEIPQPIIA